MSLKEKIESEIKQAMKRRDQNSLLALRAIKAAILNVETSEGRQDPVLTPAEELALLQKQAKQRKDSIAQFTANNRPELAAQEQAELSVIEQFLPAQLSEEEVKLEIQKLLADNPDTREFSKAIKLAMQAFAGRADGKMVSEVLKRELAT